MNTKSLIYEGCNNIACQRNMHHDYFFVIYQTRRYLTHLLFQTDCNIIYVLLQLHFICWGWYLLCIIWWRAWCLCRSLSHYLWVEGHHPEQLLRSETSCSFFIMIPESFEMFHFLFYLMLWTALLYNLYYLNQLRMFQTELINEKNLNLHHFYVSGSQVFR